MIKKIIKNERLYRADLSLCKKDLLKFMGEDRVRPLLEGLDSMICCILDFRIMRWHFLPSWPMAIWFQNPDQYSLINKTQVNITNMEFIIESNMELLGRDRRGLKTKPRNTDLLPSWCKMIILIRSHKFKCLGNVNRKQGVVSWEKKLQFLGQCSV